LTAHVFVVDERTFPVHRDRGFCGVVAPNKPDSRLGVQLDLKALRKGDLVFFYKRRTEEDPEDRGFYGVYRISSAVFEDDRRIDGVGDFADHAVLGAAAQKTGRFREHPVLPYRVQIETVVHFPNPVPDNTAYVDRSDPDHLWSMLFRKVTGPGRARSINHLLPEEERKLLRLLYKVNLFPTKPSPSTPYPVTPSAMRPIPLDLSLTEPNGAFHYENTLKAWLAENIDGRDSVIRDVFGPTEDLEFFSPEVMYGIGGDKVDFLSLHRKKWPDQPDFRYRVTVVEMKKGPINEEAVYQVQRYSRWMAQLVPQSDVAVVQPVLIGHTAGDDVVRTAETSRYGRKPIIIEYSATGGRVSLTRKL
jgi:hypothetical protein